MLAKAGSFPPDYNCCIVTTKEFNQIKFVTTFILLMEFYGGRPLKVIVYFITFNFRISQQVLALDGKARRLKRRAGNQNKQSSSLINAVPHNHNTPLLLLAATTAAAAAIILNTKTYTSAPDTYMLPPHTHTHTYSHSPSQTSIYEAARLPISSPARANDFL